MRLTCLVALLAALSSCHSPASGPQTDIRPQRDQVSFFERPQALAAARTSDVPTPVLVLLERDPWLRVIGSDSPSFALYEDGTVIKRNGEVFVSTRLTAHAHQRIVDAIQIEALRPFYGHFQVTERTDQITEQLLVYHGSKPVFISVYGSLQEPEVRSKVPQPIVAAFDTLKGFKPSEGKTWLPEKIEVMVWPYVYAPEASVE